MSFVNLEQIAFGSYADLMKDYASLAICTTNRLPSINNNNDNDEKMVKSEAHGPEVDGDDNDNTDHAYNEPSNPTQKKKRKRSNQTIPKELDTRVPFDQNLMASNARLEEHIQQCRANPIQHTIYQLMQSQLVAPTYTDPMCPNEYRSQEEIIERLKNRQGFYLNILDSSHADIMLYQAGPFRVSEYRIRNFPPCMFKENCFINRGKIKCDTNAKPFIGRELMFPDEYQHFIKTGTKNYQGVRPCVICCRYALCLYVPQLRAKTSAASRGDTVNWPRPDGENPPLQLFREKMDVEGGYLSSCMLKPNPGRWEGFIDPIAMVILSRMTIRAKQNGASSACYVDQDLLKYQPEKREQPRTGEPMSGF